MKRYFFHLRDGTDEILDREGVVLLADAVADAAVLAARDCMAADVKRGKLDLRYWIDVHDADDNVVESVPFADAVEIVSSP